MANNKDRLNRFVDDGRYMTIDGKPLLDILKEASAKSTSKSTKSVKKSTESKKR